MRRLPLPSCSHAIRVAVAFTGEGALFGVGAIRPLRFVPVGSGGLRVQAKSVHAAVHVAVSRCALCVVRARASDAVRLRCYRAQMKSVRIRDSKFGPALVIETTTRSGGYARTLAKTYVAPIRRQAEPVRPELAATFCGRAAPF